jgi:hypothetical protein
MAQTSQRIMLIRWPELAAQARIELLDDLAPNVCDAMWEALPFQTIQGHALITGHMLFATTPVTTLARENVTLYTEMGVGGCYFGNASQNLGIIYGPVTEPEGQGVWGRVLEADHDVLQRVGPRIWENLVAPFGDLTINPLAKHPILVEASRSEA